MRDNIAGAINGIMAASWVGLFLYALMSHNDKIRATLNGEAYSDGPLMMTTLATLAITFIGIGIVKVLRCGSGS